VLGSYLNAGLDLVNGLLHQADGVRAVPALVSLGLLELPAGILERGECVLHVSLVADSATRDEGNSDSCKYEERAE
jgi:hypothetical protein